MELIVHATVLYWFLFLVMRGSGKRTLAEFSPLDLLVVVVMGDLVQIGVTQEDLSIAGAVMAITVITTWTLVGDWASRRWPTGAAHSRQRPGDRAARRRDPARPPPSGTR